MKFKNMKTYKTNRILPMIVNGVGKYLMSGNTRVEIVLKREEQLFLYSYSSYFN